MLGLTRMQIYTVLSEAEAGTQGQSMTEHLCYDMPQSLQSCLMQLQEMAFLVMELLNEHV